MRIIIVIAMLLSMFDVETSYAKDKPLWGFCGKEEHVSFFGSYCRYDEAEHVWVDRTNLVDAFVTATRNSSPEAYAHWQKSMRGVRVPVKKEYHLEFDPTLFTRPNSELVFAVVVPPTRRNETSRRTVLVNVEENEGSDEYKVWHHLGLLYIGTVAKSEGYEVVLWDEHVQGPAPLPELVRPGDIVGLSLVTTGIERGVVLARDAKALGASYVIAGNDAAMFRAPQLLRIKDHPIDAVFTSNSLKTVASFYRQIGTTSIDQLELPWFATAETSSPRRSNEHVVVESERGAFDASDFFTVPDLELFPDSYWEKVWLTYRKEYGHKHQDPENVRNALVLLSQGCGRAYAGDICEYCTIAHVADMVMPSDPYLEDTLRAYRKFGINTFFNVADSSFEQVKLLRQLEQLEPVDTLVLYGRAQAIAQHPQLLARWTRVVNERLLINCGMDSADENILATGINKSARKSGSRLEENRKAILEIKQAGPKVHLHFSVIFGSPGETTESCERTLDFVRWAIEELGDQLDVVEGDIWWLNFGAPCSEIFTSYEASQRRAALAGKSISHAEWQQHFAQHADELVVPWSAQQAWYTFFTSITVEEAQTYNVQVKAMMEQVPGRIAGRNFAFKPPPLT